MSAVLVVEDDKMLGRMISTYLDKAQVEVFWARDYKEVSEALEVQDIELILLDIILPEVDGFEILRQLKQQSETRNIPVVMMSNLGGEDDMERAKALGADDYYIKANVEMEDLIRSLRDKYLH